MLRIVWLCFSAFYVPKPIIATFACIEQIPGIGYFLIFRCCQLHQIKKPDDAFLD
jgi:hypothetical protein